MARTLSQRARREPAPAREVPSDVIDLVNLLIHHVGMKKVNIHEAKTHLSRYLEEVENGETVVVCRRNVPIAEIRRLPQPLDTARPVGGAKGRFRVPESFFEPLPEDLLNDFSGSGE